MAEQNHPAHYRSLGNRKVLVVEDIEINQYLARHIMESWGFEVSIAENGRIGLEVLKQRNFDLVLMDIQMPEMDGIQAAAEIRKLEDPVKATTPIIALTANINTAETTKYLEAGMNDYLSKPIVESILFQKISMNIRETLAEQEELPELLHEEATEQRQRNYDLSLIRSLSGGDEDFVRRMIALFTETIPGSARQLVEASAEGRWSDVTKIAHKMKSTIDSMGIAALKTIIREIESKSKNGTDTARIHALACQVEETLSTCIAELQEDFNQ